jgi:hypothetical protein
MTIRFRLRWMLPLAALVLAPTLAGCVAYPAYPAYGVSPSYGYGYPAPYYGGYYVGGSYGGGWRR